MTHLSSLPNFEQPQRLKSRLATENTHVMELFQLEEIDYSSNEALKTLWAELKISDLEETRLDDLDDLEATDFEK